ncbi:MAG TPA: class I SAM-dependent methyltransferase [Acidobacteriaceae bacterium]|jgi:ubiquinone/menaquinone biosynthesis C-methylase UbiE|nr:class I SAM-dependent methyltransferase [Acidobacteriaceae bacterium]
MSENSSDQVVHQRVQEQFGATAAAYSTSAGHADRSALAALVALAEPQPSDMVLDIATGAGHTALAFAPYVREVVACDLTPAMLAETARNATSRGLGNVITHQGPAEQIPFPDAAFDIVSVRLASHHFADNAAAVREMARVAKPGGRVIIVDNYGPEDQALDDQLQHIEKLRDPSHVRSYRLSVWRQFLIAASLTLQREWTDHYSESPRGMDFDDWVRRSKTPAARVEELRSLLVHASAPLRDLLQIDVADGAIHFRLPQVTFIARK